MIKETDKLTTIENTDNLINCQYKTSFYYNCQKTELFPFVSEGDNVILYLGCGGGWLGRKREKISSYCF